VGDDWLAYVLIAAVTCVTAIAAVVVHYEGLVMLGRRYARVRRGARAAPPERRIAMKIVAGMFVLHVVEIWLFGLAYWGVLQFADTGTIAGARPLGVLDSVYLSAVTFTTVGFGDVAPVGPVRFMAGVEALLGLMLITWSASFTFIEMARHWQDDGSPSS